MQPEAKQVQHNEDEPWLQIALQEGNVFFPILPLTLRDELPKDFQTVSPRTLPLYGIIASQLMNNSINQQLVRMNDGSSLRNGNVNLVLPTFLSLPNNGSPASPTNNNNNSNSFSIAEIRKRKRNLPQKVRRVRPKVVEGKGSIQCSGMNLKKNCRCKNAALMEYTGPRPTYCAEHIDQDPNSMYSKCRSTYQKTPGDKKGCKQVVLKEFTMCYKHFANHATTLTDKEVELLLVRVKEILNMLEIEAAEAKKDRQDLYQRKNKLIPKYQKIKVILEHKAQSLHTHTGCENAFISSLLEDNPFPSVSNLSNNESKSEVKEHSRMGNNLPPLSLDDDFSIFYTDSTSKHQEPNDYISNETRIIYTMPFNASLGQNVCF